MAARLGAVGGAPLAETSMRLSPPAQRNLMVLIALVLLAAAANLPLAMRFIPPPRAVSGKTVFNVIGPEAAPYGWPASTPHPRPWPAATQWSRYETGVGHRRTIAWSAANGITTHQMEVDVYGWPIGSLQRVQRWWPFNDPAWSGPSALPGELELRWAGVILNPLLVGSLLWLAWLAPIAFAAWRSRRRQARGCCRLCGYDLRGDQAGGCPECGWNR
jgi:hypothetical protein